MANPNVNVSRAFSIITRCFSPGLSDNYTQTASYSRTSYGVIKVWKISKVCVAGSGHRANHWPVKQQLCLGVTANACWRRSSQKHGLRVNNEAAAVNVASSSFS